MTNPDGQTSSWFVITWYEADVFARTLSDSALLLTQRIVEEEPEGRPAPPGRYSNNPRLQPQPPPTGPAVNPLNGDEPVGRRPDSPRERRERLTGLERKEQREARQERQRLERLAKAGRPTEETAEESPSPGGELPEQ